MPRKSPPREPASLALDALDALRQTLGTPGVEHEALDAFKACLALFTLLITPKDNHETPPGQ